MEQSKNAACSLTNAELIDRIVQFELDGQDLKNLENFFWDCQQDYYKQQSRQELLDAIAYYELELE